MRKLVLNSAVLLFCFLLTSCLGVFYIDLGNHYAWYEDRIIVRILEEKENSLSWDILIRPQVLNYDYDDKFIIAYQVYDGSFYYDSLQRENERDSLFAQFEVLKKMKYSYWIINKESGQVFGPLRKTEFVRKCEELGVEAKLKKSNEKKFREGHSMEYIDSVSRVHDSIMKAYREEERDDPLP